MWTYSDYITQATTATRLTRLRLHIQEVSNALSSPQSVNSGGHGLSQFDLTELLKDLKAEEAQLAAATASGGGVGRIRFRRP